MEVGICYGVRHLFGVLLDLERHQVLEIEAMNEPVAYQLGGCLIRRWTPDYLETAFPDGTTCPAQFDHGPASHERAESLGYGKGEEAVRQMHLEHEISHSLVATAEGLKVSPTLWHVAHRPFFRNWFIEEAKVLAFQKYVQTGEIAEELRGLDETTDLKALCLKLKDIAARLQLPQNSEHVGRA